MVSLSQLLPDPPLIPYPFNFIIFHSPKGNQINQTIKPKVTVSKMCMNVCTDTKCMPVCKHSTVQ